MLSWKVVPVPLRLQMGTHLALVEKYLREVLYSTIATMTIVLKGIESGLVMVCLAGQAILQPVHKLEVSQKQCNVLFSPGEGTCRLQWW